MTRWRLSPKARREMMGIWNYTADHWGIEQAERYIQQIEHDLSAAAAGSPLARPSGEYLRITSGRHVCIFRRDAEGNVLVMRVLHQSHDIPERLTE